MYKTSHKYHSMIRQASLVNYCCCVYFQGDGFHDDPSTLSSAYCSSSDSMEKPAAMEPTDLQALDIDGLPSKAHDPVPPSVNDQVRLEIMVGTVTPPLLPMKSSLTIATIINLYSSLSSSIFGLEKFYLYPQLQF